MTPAGRVSFSNIPLTRVIFPPEGTGGSTPLKLYGKENIDDSFPLQNIRVRPVGPSSPPFFHNASLDRTLFSFLKIEVADILFFPRKRSKPFLLPDVIIMEGRLLFSCL